MEKYIYDESNGLWYELQGDYYIPCLKLPDEEQIEIGVWGMRHLEYIKHYRKGFYSQGDGLIPEVIAEILNEQKANQKERIKIPTEKLRKYFPKRYTATDMEKEIFAMLEKRYKEKQKDAR